MKLAIIAMISSLLALPAIAGDTYRVADRDTFVELIEGRDLTRFGITLNVTPDGKISGDAFGRNVTGAWKWKSGYFCRDLYWGKRDLGPNCQAVRMKGGKLRFISDKGTGDHADFALR